MPEAIAFLPVSEIAIWLLHHLPGAEAFQPCILNTSHGPVPGFPVLPHKQGDIQIRTTRQRVSLPPLISTPPFHDRHARRARMTSSRPSSGIYGRKDADKSRNETQPSHHDRKASANATTMTLIPKRARPRSMQLQIAIHSQHWRPNAYCGPALRLSRWPAPRWGDSARWSWTTGCRSVPDTLIGIG